ncbi:hypothetical protein NQ314_021417 [Rhamnusium bicolor]|uniref:MADF domain-containing protein n=1 Tax=Rhamnusium bicolor TaxID=1586634 RepID=A0AAV8WHS3_9CUCU|nr:hypothetical protein NQ314_021417 [Rhamnusium bicolor]
MEGVSQPQVEMPNETDGDDHYDLDDEIIENESQTGQLLKEFIEQYESPKTVPKIKPNATRQDVRKKINFLRTNYRKEFKKIISSKRSRADTEDIYQPSSWVFHCLRFLGAAEQPANMNSNVNESEASQACSEDASQVEQHAAVVSSEAPTTSSSSIGNELLSLACKYLTRPSTEDEGNGNDNFLNLAKLWATKLKNLDQWQRIFPEKTINDILFEAELGNLRQDSVKINQYQAYMNYYASTSGSSGVLATPTLPLFSPPNPPDTSEDHDEDHSEVEDLKREWKRLQDCYRQAMLRRKTKNGQSATKTKPWKYEELMSFLASDTLPRSTQSNVDDDDDDDENLNSLELTEANETQTQHDEEENPPEDDQPNYALNSQSEHKRFKG